jgi:hypothetical protein
MYLICYNIYNKKKGNQMKDILKLISHRVLTRITTIFFITLVISTVIK